MGLFIDLTTALAALTNNLTEAEQLLADANNWTSVASPGGAPLFSIRHKEIVVESAFLRAFLAWEEFLEEAFILYLMGHTAPKGITPSRHAVPSSLAIAQNLLLPEDRSFLKWTGTSHLTKRAERFFQNGEPFKNALSSVKSALEEMQTIRNAIAHWETNAKNKFLSIARDKLPTGTLPSNLTVGRFLTTKAPGSSPPETFFEEYLDKIRVAADLIIPT